MSDNDEILLSTRLGKVLADADVVYATWLECRDDFFNEDDARQAAAALAACLEAFVDGAESEGAGPEQVEARLRRRFAVACGEPFFEALLGDGSEQATDAEVTNRRPAPRVVMTRENKRQTLDWLVNSERKYRLPFTEGRFGVFSLIGTESWTDYAQVVLQTMIADSLLSIEDKLDVLIEQRAQASDEGEPDA